MLLFLKHVFLGVQFPETQVVLAHKQQTFWFEGMERQGVNHHILDAGGGEQFFLAVVEDDCMCVLGTGEETGECFLDSVDSYLFDCAFHSRAHCPYFVFVGLESYYTGHLVLAVAGLGEVDFDRDGVGEIERFVVFVELLTFLFPFLLL